MTIDYQGVQPSQPAGWHADPTRRHQYRYFDGVTWTDHVADAGIQSDDPMDRPPPPSDPWQAEPTTTGDEPTTAPPATQHVPPSPSEPERPPPMPLARPEPPGGQYPQGQVHQASQAHQAPPSYQASQTHQAPPGYQASQTHQAPPGYPMPPGYQAPPAYPQQQGPPSWAWQPVQQDARWHEPTPAGLSMVEAVKRVLGKYADFRGRAARSEYWWFVLAVNLALIAVWLVVGGLAALGGQDAAVAASTGFGIAMIASLAIVVPALAVGVRRLHDTDKSGWFLLLGLIPYIGGLIVAVLMALRGTTWPNQYGQPASVVR